MNFNLKKSIEILERTPAVLDTLLRNISEDWTTNNEGEQTWNVHEVVAHLIYGEKTDWMVRAEIIFSTNADKRFESYNVAMQFKDSKGKSLAQLLDEFKILRQKNLHDLQSKNITAKNLEQKGIHPAFGEVTLAELLSTWVVHDLNHINQVSRIMASQYREAVGPWIGYLGVLK
ncbi:MAG: DinB family protein [Ginsengibacter sp.]